MVFPGTRFNLWVREMRRLLVPGDNTQAQLTVPYAIPYQFSLTVIKSSLSKMAAGEITVSSMGMLSP